MNNIERLKDKIRVFEQDIAKVFEAENNLDAVRKEARNKAIDEAIDTVTDYQDYNPLIIERLKALKV